MYYETGNLCGCCHKSIWDQQDEYYGTKSQPHYNPALDPANFHNPKVEISPQPDHNWLGHGAGAPRSRKEGE